MTTHFNAEQWCDFVRGLPGPDGHAAVRTHLAEGCAECHRALELLWKVIASAEWDRLHEVPEPVVDRVKQMTPVSVGRRVVALPWTKARLVFDTSLQPALAGIRGEWPANRHLLYQAGRYSLDLQEQPEPGAATTALLGQISDSEQPGRSMRSVPVLLLHRTRVVAQTLTNGLGEFQIDYRPRSGLTLLVVVDGEPAESRAIGVRLRGPRRKKGEIDR